METTDVVIAGAGPVGLMLAFELRLAGVDVLVLESRDERTDESRAGGMHCRSMEVLDQRGILESFLAAGRPIQAGHFSGLMLDFSEFATRYPYSLLLPQYDIERLLDREVARLGTEIRWSAPVTGFTQDESGVAVATADGKTVRASYLVGCDGGRSAVRKIAGIGFPGTGPTTNAMLSDAVLSEPPAEPAIMARTATGTYSAVPFTEGLHRVVTTMPDSTDRRGQTADLDDLREALKSLAGTDFGIHSPQWVTRFSDAARQADRYRVGRVLLAGDAAHVHFPSGGQGLNLGVQDAVNLGWKLAALVKGRTEESLLDTYFEERHPVGARVLHNTRAQAALSWPGPQIDALREVMERLIEVDDVNRELGQMIAALDIRYDSDCAHPLAGRRVPDADLDAPGGVGRVFELLHAAGPVLLGLNDDSALPAVAGVQTVKARGRSDRWSEPVLGDILVPAAVLIRPDGHIAWATDTPGDFEGMRAAAAALTE